MKQLIFCLLLLSICAANVLAQHIDKSRYVILPYDKSDYYVAGRFTTNSVKAKLTEKEIGELEPILYQCIKEYNDKQEQAYNANHSNPADAKRKGFMIDISNYKFQFIAARTPKGDKIVWVNCSCAYFDYWNKQIIRINDGGNCFFNLMIDVTKGFYYDFSVNANG